MRHRWLLLIALGPVLALPLVDTVAKPAEPASTLTAGPGGRGPIIGIDGGWGWWSDRELALRKRRHFAWTRHEFCPIDCPDPTKYFRQARAIGTKTLCLLGNGQGPIPADPAPYADWAAGFVRQYGPGAGGQCRWLEVLNEPYWTSYSGGQADPDLYARFVRAVSEATRAADPGVRILAAVDVHWAGEGPDDGTPWIELMAGAVPDLDAHVDAFAVHPYTGDDPQTCSRTERWCFNRLLEIRRRLLAVGWGDPIWITENGVPTCEAAPGCQTPGEQRGWMKDMLEKASRWPWIKAFFIYQLLDQRTDDQSSSEYHFGLFTDDGKPKPVWEVVKRYLNESAR